jgi:hypothetical protein
MADNDEREIPDNLSGISYLREDYFSVVVSASIKACFYWASSLALGWKSVYCRGGMLPHWIFLTIWLRVPGFWSHSKKVNWSRPLTTSNLINQEAGAM